MSTAGETLALDNNRPVEVTYIPEATFDDILDIGVAKLAVRDATVIERVTEPGYDEYLTRVARLARTSWEPATLRYPNSKRLGKQEKDLLNDPTMKELEEWYKILRRGVNGTGGGGRGPACSISFMHGLRQAEKELEHEQMQHFDENVSAHPRVVVNATLYTASRQGWSWRLSRPRKELGIVDKKAVDVPLIAGGMVILGENARQSFYEETPCTVAHEVMSPRSAWEGENVKRVRALLYN